MTKNVINITLVTTTALSQCRKINPSNPQAVADQIEAMYKGYKNMLKELWRLKASPKWLEGLTQVKNAMALPQKCHLPQKSGACPKSQPSKVEYDL